MNVLIRLGVWIKKAVLLAIAVVCLVLVMWGILYKMLLAFTPEWLDEFTIVAVPLAFFVLWLLSESSKKRGAGEKDAEPVPGVPDAAAQLAENEHAPSSPVE